jgi:hypothetical protein
MPLPLLLLLVLAAGAVAAFAALRKVLNAPVPEDLHIVKAADDHTEIDERGAVRSIQSAEVVLQDEVIDELWSPRSLERLARTYWRFLIRATLGIVRIYYEEDARYVCVLFRWIPILTFQAPEYEMDDRRGVVRWRIQKGLLVARPGREGDGYLEIDVERKPGDRAGCSNVRVEVEIANFYPVIASGISRWLYTNTQSRIHVIVCQAFLRSLARLDLEESVVGRFATVDEVPDPSQPKPSDRARAPVEGETAQGVSTTQT